MKRSNRLVLLIGVFLAIAAFVGIVILLGGDGPPTQPTASAANLKTVVAAQDIPLGATLTEGMLTTADFKAADRKAGAIGEPSQIVGQKVRRPITAGAQLSRSDFLDGGADEIVVPVGMRAISIQVNQVNGVGTLIKTGDYVDLVLGVTGDKFPVVTLNPEDDSITVVQGLNSTSVKLLIEGMQVIGTIRPPTTATNRTNEAPSGSPGAQAPTTTLSDENQVLVVLAVTAQQAELIKYAQIDGDISLLLRNSLDFLDAQGNPVVSLPAGTTGVILKTLVDGGYGVLRPELVEAIIPAQ